MFINLILFLHNGGYVYETFGISKHFLVKIQQILTRAEMLDKPLIAKCFIYDVVCWPFFSPIINHIFLLHLFFSTGGTGLKALAANLDCRMAWSVCGMCL